MHTELSHNPVLPAQLRLPIRLLPSGFYNPLFCNIINRLLQQQIDDNELEFLTGKSVEINLTDAGVSFKFSFSQQKITPLSQGTVTDLTMQGSVYDFLLMLSRKEDPDTLFFNRRLKLGGDTELGLYVKNFLDGIEITEQWKYIQVLSNRAIQVAEFIG